MATKGHHDIMGKRFGRLLVIMPINETGWLCKCDCGREIKCSYSRLISGRRRSCGCLFSEKKYVGNIKHGGTGTRLYKIWQGMKERCYNPNNNRYYRYGARGIKVCDEWKNNYVAFEEWAVANGYQETLTIERKDNNKDYCPENCTWITKIEQASNKSNNRNITYNGQTKTLTQWSKDTGLTCDTLRRRLDLWHWSVEEALTLPSIRGWTRKERNALHGNNENL